MVESDRPASTLHGAGLLSAQESNQCAVSSRPSETVAQDRDSTSGDPVMASPGLAAFAGRRPELGYLLFKRVLDVVVAGVALVLLLPIFVLIVLALVIDDPGPVLFSQLRVGKNNKTFRFYKFRSMVKNAPALQARLHAENEAEGPIFKMRQDPRVTRVGRILRKYSLDELPQLVNVLRGQMSLVGPRPHLPSEVEQYEDHQLKRLSVQPGLVCLREVCGRSELTFERWIELDLHYIDCRSLRTDLVILMRLLPAVICARGAY